MSCIICELINKKLKSYPVYEDELFISFLDIKPLFLGHCLLSPKQHVRTIYDLPTSAGASLLEVIKIIGNAVTTASNAEGSFIAINNKVSQSIDHLHIHIVPRNKGDGLKGFFWPRTKYFDEEEILKVQRAIKKAINK